MVFRLGDASLLRFTQNFLKLSHNVPRDFLKTFKIFSQNYIENLISFSSNFHEYSSEFPRIFSKTTF